jgi:hypothetical protein
MGRNPPMANLDKVRSAMHVLVDRRVIGERSEAVLDGYARAITLRSVERDSIVAWLRQQWSGGGVA